MEWVGGKGVRGPIKNGRYHVEQFFNHLVSRGVSLSYIAMSILLSRFTG